MSILLIAGSFDSDTNDKDDYDDDGKKGGAVSSPGRRRLLGRAPCSKVSILTFSPPLSKLATR